MIFRPVESKDLRDCDGKKTEHSHTSLAAILNRCITRSLRAPAQTVIHQQSVSHGATSLNVKIHFLTQCRLPTLQFMYRNVFADLLSRDDLFV